MPANLTPDYLKADKRYRSASTDEEKRLALEEMLRTIPKHKGTEHMRADLKRKLSTLRKAMASGSKKGGAKHVDIFHIPRTGAGQVVLIGTPNSGKSAILGGMSKAKVNIADFPFATTMPSPGMIAHEDVHIQMIDMPPITTDHAASGCVGTYRLCDLIAIVIDLSTDVLEQMEICLNFLDSHNLLLDDDTKQTDNTGNALGKKAFVICTKSDIAPPGTMETLQELCERKIEFIEISSETQRGLTELAAKIYELLDIVRVYAKRPSKKPDMKDPFTLARGSDVMNLAELIHRELAEKLKSARAWGEHVHDGQNVHRTYELNDKDIIELHFS